MFPLTRVPFWYRVFEPQPNESTQSLPTFSSRALRSGRKDLACHVPSSDCTLGMPRYANLEHAITIMLGPFRARTT